MISVNHTICTFIFPQISCLMDSESLVSSSVLTLDETLQNDIPLSPTVCSGSQNFRNILLLHLNLIQEQQQQILSQERELVNLHHEISMLETKLRRIQRRLSKRGSELNTDIPNSLSKVVGSNPNDTFQTFLTHSPVEMKRKFRRKSQFFETSCKLELRTLIPYLTHSITNSNSQDCKGLSVSFSNSDSQLEVPSFILFSSTHLPHNSSNEDLSDSSFLKRHKKEEECEKRRKRWDIQRVRELHKIVELQKKGSQDICFGKKNPSLFLNSKASTLFSSNYLQIREIEVADTIPIFAFGKPLPAIIPKPFDFA